MIDAESVHRVLAEHGVDAAIATTLHNVFHTTGIWTTPTVTPGPENYRHTGFYTDFVPPKSFGIWTPDLDEPVAVIPPIVAMDIADENIDLDIPNDHVYVFETKRIAAADPDALPAPSRRVLDLLEGGYPDRRAALAAALTDHLDTDGATVAIERAPGSDFVEHAIRDGIGYQRFVDADRLLLELRLRKTDEEIRRLRLAAELNEAAIEGSVAELEPGMTEAELGRRYKQIIYAGGAIEQQPIEHTMIGFGAHSAFPHVVPGDRTAEAGDLVRYEVGCRYQHYPADLARTYAFQEADPHHEAVYRVLKRGIDRCADLLADHERTAAVHAGTIEYIQETAAAEGVEALEDFTMTMIGHNIGLNIHDPPLLSATDAPIEPGYVMNFELSHKDFGVGTVQIEETAVVTDDGIDRVTHAPDELPIVG